MSDIYDIARVKLLNAQLNWNTASMILSAWGGTPDFVPADNDLVDVLARGNVELGTSLLITGMNVGIDGSARTQPVVLPGIVAGEIITWLTISLNDATTHANSIPLIFIDETSEPPLPIEGNGLDLVFQPDWLANQGWWRP